jgi:hypothetical protein
VANIAKLAGETHEWYCRDVIASLRALFGKPEFADELLFAPELHFLDEERNVRVYSEMNSGKWWWSVQVCAIYCLTANITYKILNNL